VQGSEDGQALGDGDRVRVFPIEFIKGLEFEVAFYVGLDRMADIHEELVDKYFYVGLSRARSFLGVTCERSPKQLPRTMQLVHKHFSASEAFAEAQLNSNFAC
jgi:superfamily I DNA/RNA helicase